MAGCGGVCYEVDPESVRTEEKLVYMGAGMGSYQQVSSMEMVGAGKGDFEKEKMRRLSGGAVGGAACIGIAFLFLLIGFLNNWWQPAAAPVNECAMLSATADTRQHCAAERTNCSNPIGSRAYFPAAVLRPWQRSSCAAARATRTSARSKMDVKVDHTVPIPVPPPPRKVITHKVMVHTHAFDCDEGAGNLLSTWSTQQQRYCCYLRQIGCHTKAICSSTECVPTPGAPNVVPKYVHQKHYVPVPEPSPPQYHSVPVPVPVTDPGKVIKVPVPLAPQTIVKNKVLYKTRHVQVQHIYDCNAGFSNWMSGWSSDKKSWCCAHEQRGCPGSHSGQLSKTVVTGVTTHEGDAISGLSGSSATGALRGSYGHVSSTWVHHRDLKDGETSETSARRLQVVPDETMGDDGASGIDPMVDGEDVDGSSTVGGVVDGEDVDGSSAMGGVVEGEDVDGSSAVGAIVDGGDVDGSSTVGGVVDGVDGTHYVGGVAGGAQYAGGVSTVGGIVDGAHYVGGASYGTSTLIHHPEHICLFAISCNIRSSLSVARKVPVNHYVHVKMPEQPPIVHTVKVMTPAKTYSCDGLGEHPDPSWSDKHVRWCCYKYGSFCPKTVVDKNIYHTVVKTQPVRVPVPEPMPTHAPIVKTIHHTYHVPSPPQYVHVPVPGPTVVKPVVVPESVPVPVPQPPQVINVKKPYTVHVPGPSLLLALMLL
eukprot:g1067.t1